MHVKNKNNDDALHGHYLIGIDAVPYDESIAASGTVLGLKAESASESLLRGRNGSGSGERVLGEIHREGDITPYHGPLCQLQRDLSRVKCNEMEIISS